MMELTEKLVDRLAHGVLDYPHYVSAGSPQFTVDEWRAIVAGLHMALRAAPEHDTPAGQGATPDVSRRQIVFDWLMQDTNYWGGTEEVALVDELLAKLGLAPAHGEREPSGMAMMMEAAPSMEQVVEQARKDGHAEGLERAAKVCEEMRRQMEPDKSAHNHYTACAQAIRAITPKEGHGWDFDTLEHCARLIEKRAEDRQLADCYLDPDTGAMEYPSYAEDIGNALDEEAEDCAKIIRAQPAKVSK